MEVEVEEDHFEFYDWLPSILRAIIPSIKQLAYSLNEQIVCYSLSLIFHSIRQGLCYPIDFIDIGIFQLASSTRTVWNSKLYHHSNRIEN